MTETKEAPRVHPIIAFRQDLDAVVTKDFTTMDPAFVSRMKSAALAAIDKNPDLLSADRASLMSAIRQAANYGVTPDGIEATIQVYNTKVKLPDGKEIWVNKATLMPMIRGIVNRVQNSGHYRLFWAEVVYKGEAFHVDRSGGQRRAVHEIPDEFARGEDKDILGAYSVYLATDGTVDCEPMSRADIEKIRKVAKTQNVWQNWFVEKCKVAVMKRHAKRMRLSSIDMDFILNREESDMEAQPMRDVTPRTGANPLAAAITAKPAEKEPEPPVNPYADVDTTDAFPGSPAFDRGVSDAAEGKPETECPYESAEDIRDYLAGHRGWLKAVSDDGA